VYAYVAAGTYTMVVALSNVIQNIYADQSYGLSGVSTAQISLQTNGSPNANQGLLNLVGAGDVTVNTNALGQTVIESTGTVIPGTGTGNYVVTAFSGVISAPNNDILTADGSGNAKDSGVLVSSLAPKANAALTGTTTIVLANITNMNGVLNATDFAGADIGAQVNAAITQLTTLTAGGNSGAIFIPQGTYAQTTTIYLPPWIRLFGASAAGTILNFTPSATAVWAVVVAGNNTSLFFNFGYMGAIEDLTLNGPVQGGNTHCGGVYLGGSTGELDGSGTVNTSGTAVTSETGTGFSPSTWVNLTSTFIVINGVAYAIASVNSTSSITLRSSAGTQTGVAYFVVGSPLIANDPYANLCFGFNLNRVRIENYFVGMQWGTNSWSQAIDQCSIYDNYLGVSMHGAGGLYNSGENISFLHGVLSNNTSAGLYVGSGSSWTNNTNANSFNVNLVDMSLDQNGGWAVQNGGGPSQNYVSMTNCYIYTGPTNNGQWIQNYGNMLISGGYFNGGTNNSTYSIDNECQYSFTVVGTVMYYSGSGVAFNPSSQPSTWVNCVLTGASGALTGATSIYDSTGAKVAALQVTGSITTYNGFTTAGNGIPSELSESLLPNQLGNFNGGNPASIANTTANSVIRVSYSEYLERVGGSSSTLPSLTLSWTDPFGTAHTQVLVALDTTNTIAGVQHSGCVVIATNGANVTLTSAGYASNPSSGGTQMAWCLAYASELL
jgi:hypothetical protein